MGNDLIKVIPSRGYVIELSSALAVIVASMLSIPVSTTHCQVGAEIGVGMVDGGKDWKKSVNWKLVCKIAFNMVFTLFFAAGLSGGLFALLLFSPANTRDPNVINVG